MYIFRIGNSAQGNIYFIEQYIAEIQYHLALKPGLRLVVGGQRTSMPLGYFNQVNESMYYKN